MQDFTDLGDADLTLPLLALCWLALLAAGREGSATRLGGAVVAALGIVAASKLAIGTFPVLGAWAGIRSPSGHAASAALVAGALCLVLGVPGRSATGAASLAGLSIGASRVAIGVHSSSEAAAGALVGIAATAWLARLLVAPPLDRRACPAVLASAAILVGTCWGGHASIETHLESIERELRHAA